MKILPVIRRYRLEFALASFLVLAVLYVLLAAAPQEFPEGGVVTISDGASISEASHVLKSANVIRSPFSFTSIVRLMNGAKGVLAGRYAFTNPENVFQVASRVSRGETGLKPVSITIPEGLDSREIALILSRELDNFDRDRFQELAREHEGYLFPETYHFLPGVTPESVINTMLDTFSEMVQPLEGDISASGRSLDTIVTMASILEREARKYETRRTVSGILWKRIDHSIPLQVDAVFGYIFGKSGYAPSFDDLEFDSPYNTYTNRGLPPGPIANPGLESIRAALDPADSPYFYYLTGSDGRMYYAQTFEQHKANRSRLR